MVDAPSTQVTLDITQTALKKLEDSIRARLVKVLDQNQQSIEKTGEIGAKAMIRSMAGSTKTTGINVTPRQPLRTSALGKYLLSAKGAGELGIPDPDKALDVLVASIEHAVDVRTRVFRGKITISARFRPRRLLRLNPHPARNLPNGSRIDVESWLQWAAGPSRSGGTPGFGLARIGTIFSHLTQKSQIDNSKIESIIQSSRTLRKAGQQAGLMLPIKPVGKGLKSPYEALTGEQGQSWSPLPFGNNFWADWWKANSASMKEGFRLVVDSIMKSMARQLKR